MTIKQRVAYLVVGCVGILAVMVLRLWGMAPPMALSCEGLGCTDAFPELLQSTSKPCLQLACDKSDNDKKDCGDNEVKWEYWESEGQVIWVTLKVNPEIVTDRKFTAEWIVGSGEDSSKAADVLTESIVYLPPLEVRFLFDLDSAALTPLDRQQAEDEADFWLNLLWEQVIPVFNFDGTDASEKGFIYASDGDSEPEYLGNTKDKDAVYEYMTEALRKSQVVTDTRQPVGGFLKMPEPSVKKDEPSVWVVFRWRSTEDISSIKKDYTLEKLGQSGVKALVLVLGRSADVPNPKVLKETDALWKYYKGDWAKRYGTELNYVFVSRVPSDVGGQLEEFKQRAELTHEKLRIPIRVPKLLSASRLKEAALVIHYKDKCEVKVDQENLAPLGESLDISWVWPLFFTILPTISVLILVLSAVFLLGVTVFKYNLCGLWDEIEQVPSHFLVEKKNNHENLDG